MVRRFQTHTHIYNLSSSSGFVCLSLFLNNSLDIPRGTVLGTWVSKKDVSEKVLYSLLVLCKQ